MKRRVQPQRRSDEVFGSEPCWMRQHLGATPTDYVNRLRLAHARQQLEMGGQDILEVALDCGFGNLSHFYDVFRRETGTTPRAYRLAHQRPL